MRDCALKITEEKQVVLATYAMAAEALDIKTLSTLVMVTPKTDIVQSVGRILRTKHDKPIVVDLVDSHEVFQKQWVQRRRFYKKCEYTIKQISSTAYTGFQDMNGANWKMVFKGTKSGTKCAKTTKSESDDDEDEDAIVAGNCLIKMDCSELEDA
jgi:superfamily II DNA or RNA helicase